ncbi:MAG: glycosyltransferase [Candidatus Omnitrophota bacterium]|nr:glycosyltransferase [Candidatus Omnitrophota bacterium]
MMKPRVSIVIPTLGRETLYPLIENLLKQKVNFSYELVLIPQVPLKKDKLKDKKIKIHYEPLGKGFAYYRNVGIKLSRGEILVFIDDDELPMSFNWLKTITEPIIKRNEKVVTSGYKIKLGQGYWTDCISLLGFPGGGAMGFEVMWPLKNPPYTYHICSGNMAVKKAVFKKVGLFNISLKLRNEDTEFNQRLERDYKILHLKNNEVYHIARSGYFNAIKWFFFQGRSAYEIKKIVKQRKDLVANRFSSAFRILTKVSLNYTKYLPGVLFMIFNQYLTQFLGFCWEKFR